MDIKVLTNCEGFRIRVKRLFLDRMYLKELLICMLFYGSKRFYE